MKNKVNRTFTVKKNSTNFSNHVAKAPQNTGGGSSQKLTLVGAVWNESRTTVERRSTDGQSLRRPSVTHLSKALKYAAMLLMVLTLGVGQMWATDPDPDFEVEFNSSTSGSWLKTHTGGFTLSASSTTFSQGGTGYYNASANGSAGAVDATYFGIATTSPIKKVQLLIAPNSSTALNAILIGWEAAPSLTTCNTYKHISGTSKTNTKAGAEWIEWDLTNESYDIKYVRLYKSLSSNKFYFNGTSDKVPNPSSTQTCRVYGVRVWLAASGPSISSFSPATGATVGASQTITITGSTGSTVYYMWATSDPANAAAVVSADQHGTAGAASATTTVESDKTLYAVAVKDATNSAVASASYTVDATAPTLSSSKPANSATNIGTSGNIVLTFSENVTINDASKFSLSGGTLNTAGATVSDAKVTIPYSGLSEGTEYTFSTAAGAVKDAAGNTSAALSDITFTTVKCEVSSCGNASLTYAINGGSSGNHSSGGADLIASATPSNPTALGASTTPGYTGIEMSTLTKNKAAATNSCFTEQINMSGKIDMNNGGSYSSSKYLQFTFTVKEGYTFTPCDIQFVVQPVSATGYFRWEVTDGTTSYGYGTGSAGKGSDAGATVLTGLSSTSEMSDGTYYIRLYPYYNGSNTFRIGDNVILRGTTAEAAPAASGWYLKGSFDTWGDGYAMAETGTNIVSVERTLDANSHYQFKIVNGSDWYGNGEIFGGTKTKTVSDIGTSNNCHLITSEEGKYRFDYNTETNALTITYPNSYTYYYSNTDGWSKVYVYKFSSKDEMTGDNDTWPGVEIETPTSLCGSYYAATSDGYAKIIFTNGLTGDNEKKTSDMVVASADAGKYVAGTGSAWVAMPTFSVTYNKNGDGAGNDGAVTGNVPTDATAYACGADVTVLGNTGNLALAGYSFNGWNTAANGTGIAKVADETYAISDNTTFYAQWLQEIPTSVVIGGTWKYFPGQTISLTTTPTDGTSDFTYQWQQSNGSAWEDIEGANSDTYTKENCTVTDARKYRCIVSKLGASVTSDEYKVHIYTLEGDYSGGSDWKVYNIAQTSGTVGTVAVDLDASSLFEFGIKDNYDNSWYRNTNFIVDNWTNEGFGQGSCNCRLFTGPEGNYTFTVNLNHVGDGTPYMEVSVAYPSVTHPVAGYAYFKKWNDWAGYYIHWWYNDGTDHPLTEWGSDVHITNETSICGTDYIYFPVIANYDQLKIKDAAGDASHYTDNLSSVGSSGKYFDFTNDNAWNAFPSYTITFNSNGGSDVAEQHVSCGGTASEPAAPTRLNYDFEGWQLAGADYNFATVVDDDITLDAVWTRKAVPGSEEAEEAYVADVEHAKENPVTPPYTGTAFDLAHGGLSIVQDKSTATNTADSKSFDYAFLPNGSTSESSCYTLTAKKAISSLVIYYTATNGSFSTDDQSKSGNITYKINSGSAVVGEDGNKSNKIAYKQTISNIAKDDVVKIYASNNRLAIFGIYATYIADAPSVKLKVLGEVTQTISITVGEKLGEIFASGSLPTPSLPDGYTFKGWKNEANDAAVDNNTVTTGSMVIYADVDAPASTDATLSALTVNGDAATVDELDATKYTFTLPFGTTAVPTVVATPNDANAVATVTANTLSGATIEVVPESGEDDKVTYTITYSIESSKDIRMVWKKTGNPCGESSAPTAFVLSTDDAIKDYLSISFVQTTEDNSKKAEEKSDGYLSTGKSVGNLVKITAKPGYAFKNMSFYGKIESGEIQCPVSIDGGVTWTNVTGNLGSDAQHCDVFTNAETHEIILKNNGGAGTWIRHMDLTMIQACTPKTIAWTAEPAAEYELGSSPDAIAASANNGTVSYASTDGDVIAVNESTGALTLKTLGTVTLSASVPAGDGAIYCDEDAQVSKANVKTYYLVTFDKQNETTPATVKYYKNDAAIALPEDPTYSGFNFLGWFDAAEGGNAVTSAITPSASRTVYAQWEAQCAGPTIETQPESANYFVGRTASTLSCEATPGVEGKALTYTWYSSDDAVRTNPVELAGAPTPSTAAVGTFYYYCAVTEEDCDVIRNSNVVTINVTEKDMLLLIQANHVKGKTATISGYIGGTYHKEMQDNAKLGSKGNYFGIKLASGTFQAGDRVYVHTAAGADTNGDKVRIFKSNAASAENVLVEGTEAMVSPNGDNWVTLPATTLDSLYLRRGTDTENYNKDWNPYIDIFAVYRPYPVPVLAAMTINGSAATINGTNVTATIASNAELASLDIDPTFMSNDPTQTNGALGDWTEVSEGVYTASYVVTDKDEDTNTYLITLTRDVEIASITISGETSVMEGSQITLTATVLPNNVINKAVVWSSSDETKAEVDEDGVVTAKAAGAVTITATSVADNTKFGTYDITVTGYIGTKRVYWFAYADDAAANNVSNNSTVFGSAPTGSNSGAKEITLEEGWVMNTTKYAGAPGSTGTFVVPAEYTATFYAAAKASGNGGRYIQLKQGDVVKYTSNEFEGNDPQVVKIEGVAAGTYTIAYFGGMSNFYLYAAELSRYAITSVTLESGFKLRTEDTRTPAMTLVHAKAAIASQTWSILSSTATGTTINEESGLITAGTTPGTITVQVEVTDAMSNVVTSNICTVEIVEEFERIDVTGSMTWNWNELSMSNVNVSTSRGLALANYIDGEKWQMLNGTNGDYAYRNESSGCYEAMEGSSSLSFHTTVPGMVKITGRRRSNDAVVKINGEITVGTVTSSVQTFDPICVAPGEVAITPDANGMRITKLEFIAMSEFDPAEAEESKLGGNERTVDPQYYGTVCLPKAGVMTGAMLFQVAYMDYKEDGTTPYKVYYDQVENGVMQAGMPYIFLAEESTIGVYYTGTAEETAKDHNGLHGTLVDMVDMSGTGIYMLYNNKVLHSTNSASSLPANRAYLQISEIPGYNNPGYKPQAPKYRRISTNFNGTNSATGMEEVNSEELRVQKMLINGQIYILRGEKMYDVTGKVVK